MTEEKYNTKDIRHINKKNQEYIAEGNRMTEEIIIDGVNVAGCCQLIEEPFYPCGLGGECKGWENHQVRIEPENKLIRGDK